MSKDQSRLELLIDVFELKAQRALAQPSITPPELVSAVLHEFRELDYLGTVPGAYRFLKASDRSPLELERPLSAQLTAQDKLILVENILPLPANTTRPSKRVYLREPSTGMVYKLQWLPAIIGRSTAEQTKNEQVAIDLAPHPMGLRVSRRHAQITEENGQFFLEGLSQNPTKIMDSQSRVIAVGNQKQAIRHGDVIVLDHSQITLKVLIRD